MNRGRTVSYRRNREDPVGLTADEEAWLNA